jgi:hypothetical protein
VVQLDFDGPIGSQAHEVRLYGLRLKGRRVDAVGRCRLNQVDP